MAVDKKMNEFKSYHPIVNFLYFAFVIGFSMVFMHPVCLALSLVSGFIYSVMLGGGKTLRFNLACIIPLILVAAIINPAFNHEGMTILCYLPSGNPLTKESIWYGVAAATMIAAVINWFSCFNKIMTSDKFIYLFGKVIPSLSLILSMVLRFIPKFNAQIKTVSAAQKCIGRDASDGNIIRRAKNGIKILSILITWSLENAIDTADSMKSRGYGLPNRTAFSNFKFDRRDFFATLCICVFASYIFIGAVLKGLHFRYFPGIKGTDLSTFSISLMLAYLLLCIFPIIIECWEAIKWNKLKSKI